MSTLHLTQKERRVFEKLADSLREGWTVESETLTYDDTPPRQMMRLSLVRLHDPKLLALRKQAEKCRSIEEAAVLMAGIDLKDVNDDDIAALFFGLGPAVIDQLIAEELPRVKNDQELEGIAALSQIRHSILSALLSAA